MKSILDLTGQEELRESFNIKILNNMTSFSTKEWDGQCNFGCSINFDSDLDDRAYLNTLEKVKRLISRQINYLVHKPDTPN